MENYIEQIATQSPVYVLLAVVGVVALLESLALVGMLLPGAVMMASLGALIGAGKLGFYPAWLVGFAGALLGDWLSYFLGRWFQQPLRRWSLLRKYQPLLDRTEQALYQHSMVTLLLGRFIGPTRPLVPMMAGMLALPVRKFAVPSAIGCITWPPVYFFPGILAGVAIYIPDGASSSGFKWQLLLTALLLWSTLWLSWRWWRSARQQREVAARLSRTVLRWLCPLSGLGLLGSLLLLLQQPMLPVFRQLLWKVLAV